MKLKGRFSAWRVLACLGVLIAAAVGCGGGGKPANNEDGDARRAMTALAEMYGKYMSEHRGAPPKDEQTFKKFLAENAAQLNDKYKASDPNALFISLRDKQPLGVLYGKVVRPADGLGSPWAVYEREGVDGVRWAAQVRGGPVELSAEEFARELPGK